MRRKPHFGYVLILFLLISAHARAYRPFNGTDADVADQHEFELEMGLFGLLRAENRNTLATPALIINYGLLPRFELVLEGRHLYLLDAAPGERRSQIVDTALSLKSVVRKGSLQDESGPSIALEGGVILPETGDEQFGAELAIIASERGRAGTLHLNVAAELTRDHSHALLGSLIVEGPIEWPLRPVAEAFAEEQRGGDATELAGLVGAIWRLCDPLSLDLAYRLAYEEDAGPRLRVQEVRVGLTWAFSVSAQPLHSSPP